MQPEEQARLTIDRKLEQSGWTIQDMSKLNLTVSLGVAVREFPTSTGPVDYSIYCVVTRIHPRRFNPHKTNAANEELVISLFYRRKVQERKPTYRLLHHYTA